MQKNIVKKGLVIAIIFLFIAVSFQPVFAIINKSNEESIINNSVNNDKNEYIIEIVKEDEIIRHSVFLTEEEEYELETLISSVKSELNNSKSTENTDQIFYDAVDSFNSLGIFPENVIALVK